MRQTLRLAVALPFAMAAGLLAGPATAHAAIDWAPAKSASIHPGVQTHTNGAQCTSNFVFSDGTNVYLGQAAHCSSTSSTTTTNGCEAASRPLGTKVDIEGASKPGVMVYNSWLAMQKSGETNANACMYDDLALVRINAADVADVNPTIPFWGGPEGLNTTGTRTGETVYSYGNSELRLGLSPLGPKRGVSAGDAGGGWSHTAYTVTPGIPGDSGSAFLDAQGRALGILSTLDVLPKVGSNGVGDLAHELAYMHGHSSFGDVHLVNGTEAFNGSPLAGLLG
ncbi:MAG: hypothetical protein ACRDN9_01395 [Streptosporangiaceae bacterium]